MPTWSLNEFVISINIYVKYIVTNYQKKQTFTFKYQKTFLQIKKKSKKKIQNTTVKHWLYVYLIQKHL